MNIALLPVFGGELHEPWELHELRLLSWLRVQHIQPDNDSLRIDCLLLSLRPNSTPLSWFHAQPSDLKASFVHALDLLRTKYGSDLRKEMQRISALNCLEVRSFRDSEHKTEMVFELINELEQLLSCGSVDQDVQRRDYLLRCFRGFSGALKMMNRATSYDRALLAALNWESSVISKAEEAMIQAGIRRQLAQKPQHAQTHTKRKSNPSRPANPSDQHETAEPTHHLTTQDFQRNTHPIHLHPDAKTHPPSSFQQKPFQSASQDSFHPLQQCFDDNLDNLDSRNGGPNQETSHKKTDQLHPTACDTSSAAATAHVTPPTRDDTDPSQMMESLVDPHIATEQSNGHPQRFNEPNGYERFAHMRLNGQEILDSPSYPQKSQIKPLVYDPKKNPYPPPEQLPENRPQAPNQFPSFPLPHSFERNTQNLTASNSRDLGQAARLQANSNRRSRSNSSYPDAIPFPSTSARGQAPPSSQPPGRSPVPPMAGEPPQSGMMLPGSSSSQHGTHPFDSAMNLESNTGSMPAQFTFHPLSQRRSGGGGTSPAPQRRPSKLVKLRRNGSSSSNNSSVGRRSSSSLRQIRNLIGSISRRRSRASQSGDESDSTQDHGPNTPSTLEPGGVGSGFESEGNERIRPMQVQFSRLFRKHNHPEHLRQAHRSMLVNRYRSAADTPAAGKGKARALDVNSAASGVVGEYFSQRDRSGRPTASSFKHPSSPNAQAPGKNPAARHGPGGVALPKQKSKASSRLSRWKASGF